MFYFNLTPSWKNSNVIYLKGLSLNILGSWKETVSHCFSICTFEKLLIDNSMEDAREMSARKIVFDSRDTPKVKFLFGRTRINKIVSQISKKTLCRIFFPQIRSFSIGTLIAIFVAVLKETHEFEERDELFFGFFLKVQTIKILKWGSKQGKFNKTFPT